MRKALITGILYIVSLIAIFQLFVFLFNYVSPLLSAFLLLLTIVGIIHYFPKLMKPFSNLFLLLIISTIGLSSCGTYVQPNYVGVLQENYGKNGKSDFSLQKGKVNTFGMGTELFQVPLFEQRGEYAEPMHLKAADNTEFAASPTYSYKVIESRAIDVVFNNKHLNTSDFLEAVEDNVLEMRIRDIIKEESRRYTTDTLMANSGSLKFEERVQKLVAQAFEKEGIELISFSSQLDFPARVKNKIEERNEVNQQQSVVDQQIEVAKKNIELAKLKAQEQIELSKGITPEILQQRAIEGWIEKGCPTPAVISNSNTPIYTPTIPKVK